MHIQFVKKLLNSNSNFEFKNLFREKVKPCKKHFSKLKSKMLKRKKCSTAMVANSFTMDCISFFEDEKVLKVPMKTFLYTLESEITSASDLLSHQVNSFSENEGSNFASQGKIDQFFKRSMEVENPGTPVSSCSKCSSYYSISSSYKVDKFAFQYAFTSLDNALCAKKVSGVTASVCEYQLKKPLKIYSLEQINCDFNLFNDPEYLDALFSSLDDIDGFLIPPHYCKANIPDHVPLLNRIPYSSDGIWETLSYSMLLFRAPLYRLETNLVDSDKRKGSNQLFLTDMLSKLSV